MKVLKQEISVSNKTTKVPIVISIFYGIMDKICLYIINNKENAMNGRVDRTTSLLSEPGVVKTGKGSLIEDHPGALISKAAVN